MLIKSLPYCHVLFCLCLHHVFHLLHPQHPTPLYSSHPPTHTHILSHTRTLITSVVILIVYEGFFSVCCLFCTQVYISEISKFKKSLKHQTILPLLTSAQFEPSYRSLSYTNMSQLSPIVYILSHSVESTSIQCPSAVTSFKFAFILNEHL